MSKYFSAVSCGVHELSNLSPISCFEKKGGEYYDRARRLAKTHFQEVSNKIAHAHIGNHTTGKPDPKVPAHVAGCAFVMFSDAVKYGNGEAFAKIIRDNNLGGITETPEVTNPNSGNKIKVYLWEVDYKALALLLEQWGAEDEPKTKPAKVAATPTVADYVAELVPQPVLIRVPPVGLRVGHAARIVSAKNAV